eukprot:5935076-Amphidinium_carterae.1
MKAAVKKDRSGSQRAAYGSGVPSRGAGLSKGKGKGKGKGKRLSISELKLISRCANCGQRRHWRAECTNPYKARGDSGQGSREPAAGSTLFVYNGAHSQQPTESEAERLQAFVGLQTGTFATWTQGTALVDTGAAQDVIGEDTYMRLAAWWAKRGVFPVDLPRLSKSASGVGGETEVIKTVLLPISIAKRFGVVATSVLRGSLPHLLSVGYLSFTQCLH